MPDFEFLQNPLSRKWMVLAPRRAHRPDGEHHALSVCPFCPGHEKDEPELYRLGGQDTDDNWQVRVIPNKFPFAQIHELIIHSPDHHKSFDELPMEQSELILQTFRQRFQVHQKEGQVYIFHNHGEAAGESLPHPHTQLVVVPFAVTMEIPRLDPFASADIAPKPLTLTSAKEGMEKELAVETKYFYLFCPQTSQWPDEVWIVPKKRGQLFGQAHDEEIADLAMILFKLIHILDLRHGHEFPFNFYIYPQADWYLRLIPRVKSLGGFEIGTNIYINTQDPKETIAFIKEHFETPNEEKIRTVHRATYKRNV